MENKELAPIVLANDFENVSDILAGSEEDPRCPKAPKFLKDFYYE
jgi:hypothetical protein